MTVFVLRHTLERLRVRLLSHRNWRLKGRDELRFAPALTSPGCFPLCSRTQRNAAWHSNFPFNRDRYGIAAHVKKPRGGAQAPMIQADDGSPLHHES
jgi:hypothetical protein